jgi:hypothetical protein
MENNSGGCLIWVVLFFVAMYGCTTRMQLDETKQELKDLRNKPTVVEIKAEKPNESN